MRALRTFGQPFALLVIDLDGFKVINDTHGHAAGDACLQHFTLMAQTRLRPGDMLARTGGDEFCIVLPASTLREGAMIARRVLEVCRADAEQCTGNDIPIAVSIGVAQWAREMGGHPDRLIAAADHALYAAKKAGRDGFATYDPAPPLAPEPVARRSPASPCASAPKACGYRLARRKRVGQGLSMLLRSVTGPEHEPSLACAGGLAPLHFPHPPPRKRRTSPRSRARRARLTFPG